MLAKLIWTQSIELNDYLEFFRIEEEDSSRTCVESSPFCQVSRASIFVKSKKIENTIKLVEKKREQIVSVVPITFLNANQLREPESKVNRLLLRVRMNWVTKHKCYLATIEVW